jgi:hypothetical protein
MNRVSNWPSYFDAAVENLRAPFTWGKNDCCIGACNVLCAITGDDPGADLRDTYDSALSAARILKKMGGVEAITESRCLARGWIGIDPLSARRGDLVLIDTEQGAAVGICIGSRVLFAGGEERPLKTARRAWRVN